ncbi:MAG: hypothetical protein HYZ22_13920 [Chloroflexi bacterium]|nr:hypothetical protein [Chloroflexota bacterium]
MTTTDPLEYFGAFLVANLRDQALHSFDNLSAGRWKAPALKKLQFDMAKMPEAYREIARRAIVECIDSAIHDFLFALKEQADFENRIIINVDGTDVVKVSQGIHGEPYGDEGWFAKYSHYGSHPDIA